MLMPPDWHIFPAFDLNEMGGLRHIYRRGIPHINVELSVYGMGMKSRSREGRTVRDSKDLCHCSVICNGLSLV